MSRTDDGEWSSPGTNPGDLSRQLAALQREHGDTAEKVKDLHERFREVEAYHHQGRPIHLETLAEHDRTLKAHGERWSSMDKDLGSLRTTVKLWGAIVVTLVPVLTALAVALVGLLRR